MLSFSPRSAITLFSPRYLIMCALPFALMPGCVKHGHTQACKSGTSGLVDSVESDKGKHTCGHKCHHSCALPCCDPNIPIIRLTGIIERAPGGFAYIYDSGDNGTEPNPPGIPLLPFVDLHPTAEWYRIFVRDNTGAIYRLLIGPRPREPGGDGDGCFEPRTGTPQLNFRRGWVYLWGLHPRAVTARGIAVGTGTNMHLVAPPVASGPEAIIFQQTSPTATESVTVTKRDDPTAPAIQLLPSAAAGAKGSYCKLTQAGAASLISASEQYPPASDTADLCNIANLDTETLGLRNFAHAP